MVDQIEIAETIATYLIQLTERDLNYLGNNKGLIINPVERIYRGIRTNEKITLIMSRNKAKSSSQNDIYLTKEQYTKLEEAGFVTFEDGLGDIVIRMR